MIEIVSLDTPISDVPKIEVNYATQSFTIISR